MCYNLAYLKVTYFHRYICLRFYSFVHFAGIIFWEMSIWNIKQEGGQLFASTNFCEFISFAEIAEINTRENMSFLGIRENLEKERH